MKVCASEDLHAVKAQPVFRETIDQELLLHHLNLMVKDLMVK
jgi:hypothetical protein